MYEITIQMDKQEPVKKANIMANTALQAIIEYVKDSNILFFEECGGNRDNAWVALKIDDKYSQRVIVKAIKR